MACQQSISRTDPLAPIECEIGVRLIGDTDPPGKPEWEYSYARFLADSCGIKSPSVLLVIPISDYRRRVYSSDANGIIRSATVDIEEFLSSDALFSATKRQRRQRPRSVSEWRTEKVSAVAAGIVYCHWTESGFDGWQLLADRNREGKNS